VSRRRAVALILGLIGGVIVVAAGAIALLATSDVRPFIERYAARTLGREVAIGTLSIGWGNPLRVELHDLRLANAPWGSVPNMVRIDGISAELDLRQLLAGVLRFQKLSVVNPVIVLERDADGTGNWRFNKVASSSHFAVVPKNRTQFPTLIDFALRDGRVSYRTSSGALLRIDMRDVTMRSLGDDQPVSLAVDGAYNGVPARMSAEMQSFAVLRDARVPYGMTISLQAAASKGDFNGTMTEPLDVEGMAGTLKLEGRNLGEFLKIFGTETPADFPFSAAGAFHRKGDDWRLADAKGKLAANAFIGTLALTEAARGKPDELTLALDFAQLDLAPLMGSGGTAKTPGAGDLGALPLHVDASRGTNIAASITAKQLDYPSLRVADVAARGRIAAGDITVSQLAFAFADGKVDLSGTAHALPVGSRVTVNASASGTDAGRISEMLGAEAGQIMGKLDGAAALEMTGATLGDALRASRGHAVLAMAQGSVARALVERASVDLRSFFRKGEGTVRLDCLLGVIDLRNGVGTISPLKLRTQEASLIGAGKVDLPGKRLDLTIKAEPHSTGLFALDVPFRVSGEFAALKVQPEIAGSTAWLDAAARNNPAPELPPKLQQLVAGNPCIR